MLKQLANILARWGRSIFGSPNWTPAPWMQKSSNKIKAKPQHSLLILLGLVLLGLLSGYIYQWYQHRPQPITFDANIQAPAIPAINSNTPANLDIKFSINQESLDKALERATRYHEYEQEIPKNAMRLDKTDKDLQKEITIEPFVEGQWHSTSDGIYFRPKKNWPADVTYTLRFLPDLFLDQVSLSQSEYTFTSAPLSVKTNNFKLHSDPTRPGEQRVIATLEFTHPVDENSLKEKLQLDIQDNSETGKYQALDYTLTADAELSKHRLRVFHLVSSVIKISDQTRFLKMELHDGVKTVDTGHYYTQPDNQMATLANGFKQDLSIPSVQDFFKIGYSNVQIVRDENDNPQQALIIELTDAATPEIINDQLKVFLLPQKNPERLWERWSSASEISPDIIEQAKRLKISSLPIENDSSQVFSFIFSAAENRQLFVRLKKGTKSSGGFITSNDFRVVHQVPNYPKEVSIMGVGSVLNRTGAHQVGFVSRGVQQLRVSISQVRTDQINHLISQTNGDFKNPDFRYPISPEHISVVAEEVIALRQEANGQPTYSSIDLSAKLDKGDLQSGLFHINVKGEDRDGRYHTQAQRIILITDIGFLNKINADTSQEVFVQSISTREPMGKATVSVLGKNGLAVFTTTTDSRGHARIPDLSDLKREKTPIALLVERGKDLAYLPTQNQQRLLNTSRFETGGVYWNSQTEQNLQAMLFTDRGIYRPGEKVQLGIVVRDFDLGASENFPVELSITDPRGVAIYQQKHRLPDDGFFEAELKTMPYSATGIYTANLSLPENKQKNYSYQYLGSVDFSVEEFQPDRLKIRSTLGKTLLNTRSDANISDGTVNGWLKPGEVVFDIDLQNLFGTPAQDRKVSGDYRIIRQDFSFSEYEGYRFTDAFNYKKNPSVRYSANLKDTRTDQDGLSSFDIDLDKFVGGTFQLVFNTSGYEESGGRSVQARNTIRFSPRDFLIGYKTEGSLNYLKRNQEQVLDLLCIDRFSTAIDCESLTLQITERKYISTLVKQRNGIYQYQSIQKNEVISKNKLALSASGYTHKLDTTTPGQYALEIFDHTGELRQQIEYQVVGSANLNTDLEKDSQLDVVLNKSEYAAGDWIELQLKAPYTGSGLISIESTNMHHFTWFKADSTQSMQRIQVPEGLQGNAYIQVAFVRAPDSKEIFTAPLSYAIAPFRISRKPYKLELEIDVAKNVQPGQPLNIQYRSDHKSRLVIFAVDEGILQVAKYQAPKPLDHFLQQRALQVQTFQMFDLLLPEFSLMRELSAAGGGMAEKAMAPAGMQNLNPFARTVKNPVAYWSGIIEAGPEQQQVTYQVPDHFDGSLRVMAVAISDSRFAHAQEHVTVRGPFIVSPNVPTVVAPGDTFQVTVGVSNQVQGSGDNSRVRVSASVSEHLQVIGNSEQNIGIPEGDERSVQFTLKANNTLGSADISFVANSIDATEQANTAQRRATATLSVRPATLLHSNIQSGVNKKGESIVPLTRDLLPDMAQVQLFASPDPALLINGLISYLKVFPHTCTEQIVSQVTPILAFVDHPNYLGTPSDKHKKLESLFQGLRQRQLSNGGFTLWPGGHTAAGVPSVLAVHTMLDAREREVKVPAYVIDNGLEYLKSIAFDVNAMRSEPELVAYALYLLTRSGEQTNNALVQLETVLQESASKDDPEAWKKQLVSTYMASSYQLLKREKDAQQLIRHYRFKNARSRINRYDSALYRDAMAMYLMARHFPDEFKRDDTSRLEAIIEPILSGNLNTLSSGRALLALRAYSDLVKTSGQDVAIDVAASNQQVSADKGKNIDWRPVLLKAVTDQAAYPFADLNYDDRTLRINTGANTYYQTTQAGFDRAPPALSESQGLEVSKTFYNSNGTVLKGPAKQGDDVIVKLSVRSTDNQRHDDIAIIDLLPGGFEIDRDSVRDAQKWNPEYIDIREDRLVYYGSVGSRTVDIRYKARITASGAFAVPAVYANAMYDEKLYAHSAASRIQVSANQ